MSRIQNTPCRHPIDGLQIVSSASSRKHPHLAEYASYHTFNANQEDRWSRDAGCPGDLMAAVRAMSRPQQNQPQRILSLRRQGTAASIHATTYKIVDRASPSCRSHAVGTALLIHEDHLPTPAGEVPQGVKLAVPRE
jgi:hypothetical protein